MANTVGADGTQMSVLFAVLSAAIGLGIVATRLPKLSVVVGAALALLIWVAEGFGGIFTGTGTDPNTGLLLILLAACYWPYVKRRPRHLISSSHTSLTEV